MENRKRVIVAVLCGFLAVFITMGYLHHREQKLLELASAVEVVVAAKDIDRNARLDETVLEIRRIPRKYVQPHAITGADLSSALGQVAASPILEGEQVLTTKLLRFGRTTGLALKVNPGMRAVSVLVDDVTGIAGLIKANDRVDVLGTFDFGDKARSKYYTFTLFQNVSVLALNDDMGEGYSSLVRGKQDEKGGALDLMPQTKRDTFVATLSMTPEQVQNLVLSQEIGKLSLALRGLSESDAVLELEPATPAELTNIQSLIKRNDQPIYQQYRGGRR
jgi:pilus assembly protein CpaB